MNATSTFERLRLVISQMSGVEPAEVLPVSRLRGFAIDSLGAYELVTTLEAEFGIELDLEHLANVVTVENLSELVDLRRRTGAVASGGPGHA